ncbi:MAG: GNAT family N-acetyltransferase [Dermatophilaceae bacterium]
MSTAAWTPLTAADLTDLSSLARECLRADGGLPQLAHEATLRRLFLTGPGIGGRDETGDLVAAAAVCADSGRRTATGLVRPSARRQGLGEQLVAWCVEHADGQPLRVLTETTSPDTEAFVGRFGLSRVFAEQVLRHDLVDIPRIRRPGGMASYGWRADTVGLFHAAYVGSFSDQPRFPESPPSVQEWAAEVRRDPGFHPEWSRVVVADDGTPAGFVILTDDWVEQVGVVPAWRRRRLGAHLVVRSLRRLRRAQVPAAWLAVTADNPARGLYLRLGFVEAGERARYELTLPPHRVS